MRRSTVRHRRGHASRQLLWAQAYSSPGKDQYRAPGAAGAYWVVQKGRGVFALSIWPYTGSNKGVSDLGIFNSLGQAKSMAQVHADAHARMGHK